MALLRIAIHPRRYAGVAMLATFFSHPVVWSTSLVELFTLTSIVAFVVGAYRHIECHHTGCHRFARFPHGHYKLCRIHHPQVPPRGRSTRHA
jgi:hypothetical protein